jgi:glycosyltransferase involved in cell wall biosynthesis
MSPPPAAGASPLDPSGLRLQQEGEYHRLSRLALSGRRQQALEGFNQLLLTVEDSSLRARIFNDFGVLAKVDGRVEEAIQALQTAQELDPAWQIPGENLRRATSHSSGQPQVRPTRIAIISLLFNWPSTGGGTVHTAETAKFLSQAGYDVRHFFAEYPEWGLGNVTEPPLGPAESIHFASHEWHVDGIQKRFREVLHSFQPDWVIVTDSWNSKPILAEAARDFRFFLRIAAQECLCPLNNVRLLVDQGKFTSCPKHQLATPEDCCRCVSQNGKFSGGLHQAERELMNYGSGSYDSSLRWAFTNAEAVLVVNPLIATMVSPYAKKVCVVPSGFDIARFPSPSADTRTTPKSLTQILFAGLVNEPMKGFAVLQEACQQLWDVRRDFELVATADPPGRLNAFTRYIGWHTQSELPNAMLAADIVACPTIAEEALGRTAVEAMGAGRPVVASRVGGLQFTVLDEATGLLCQPGDVRDLVRQLHRLLDSAELRVRMGETGRKRFEQHYTWDVIIERHYRELLGATVRPV